MVLAQYQCTKCNRRWQDKPGPVDCPICTYVYCNKVFNWPYIVWLNYEEMFVKKGK